MKNLATLTHQLESEINWTVEDLKSFAAARCLSIFDDFHLSEIIRQPKSVQDAWAVGKQLKALHNN